MSNLKYGYAVIPNDVLYDTDLSSSAKLLYACVASLSAKQGYCFASNKYLAGKLGLKVRQIQYLLKELEDHLTLEDSPNGQRLISLEGVQKNAGGGAKNDTHNNTSIINKKINKKDKAPKEDSEDRLFFESLVGALGLDKNRTLFSNERRKKLVARLRNFRHDDILLAAKAIQADPFMQGQNDRNTKYGTIDYLLRNDEKLEYWRNKATPNSDKTQDQLLKEQMGEYGTN